MPFSWIGSLLSKIPNCAPVDIHGCYVPSRYTCMFLKKCCMIKLNLFVGLASDADGSTSLAFFCSFFPNKQIF